ncbi:MAG: cytochrome c [Deltaproteobacteria bacterium]|nr:cytochrome c [Deltaproteobacteria bacterium]
MHKAMKGLRFPLLALGALLVTSAGCTVEREPNMEFAPWINHMMFSSAAESFAPSPVNAKTGKPVFANGRVNQLPPAGTIPRDFVPLHFSNDEAGRLAAAAAFPKAPVEASPENLARGAWGFATFCVPCHAADGSGAGLVAKKAGWNFPIGYTDSNAGKWADGYLFHLVSYGRNNMPSYASQINQLDRWKIILHLRALQQQNGAAPVDPAAAATATAPAAAATPAAK